MRKEKDLEYRDVRIRSVKACKSGWEITGEDGLSFWVKNEWGIKPCVGDVARFYMKEHQIVRGLDINGQECFYRTPKQEAERRAQKARDYDLEQKADFKK